MAFLSKWTKLGSLASALLVTLALACGGGAGSRIPSGNLQVVNGGNSRMTSLYVTPSASTTWGVDQLAPDSLVPGADLTLTGVDPDFYDIEAIFADGSTDRVFDVLVQDRATTVVTSVNTGNGTVVVANQSGLSITGVYLTPSTSSTWGPNQTGGTSIPSGQSLTLTGVSPDTYDLRVYLSDGSFQDATPPVTVTAGTVITLTIN
jgi:hypothetical protein